MSEQEKKNAIPAEGTVEKEEVKKKGLLQKMKEHPKLLKAAKVALNVLEGVGLVALGYFAGLKTGGKHEENPALDEPAADREENIEAA